MAGPTIPPRHAEKEHKQNRPEHQRVGSVRAAFDHGDSQERTRTRLDSSGSTRGAFYTGSKKQQPDSHHHHRRKKKSPKKSPPPPAMKTSTLSSNAEAMGNMASLAMAGLAEDDIGGFLDGSSPLKQERDGVRFQEPLQQPHPFSSSQPVVESPLSDDDIEAPSPRGLETILDDSDVDFSDAAVTSNQHYHAAPPPSRSAYAATRTQLSEQSLDIHDLQPPQGARASPKESLNTMQYSGATLDNSGTSFLRGAAADIPLSMRTADSGLHGMDIPLSMRTADFEAAHGGSILTMSNDQNNAVEVMIPNNARLFGGGAWYQQQHQQQPYSSVSAAAQQQDIANFASMALQADYGTTAAAPPPPVPSARDFSDRQLSRTLGSELNEDDDEDDDVDVTYSYEDDDDEDVLNETFIERVRHCLDPTEFLISDATGKDDDGHPIFEKQNSWTIPALLRHVLYNPEYPEFTSLQQFSWAVILGIVMGMYTAVWKYIIEWCVDFVWVKVPGTLYRRGVFTDLDGKFPLPNYMWICPAIFGGVLSYIFVVLPKKIPGQNEWIEALHARGVQGHETFWPLFVLSTLGMSSGLSLGPELPLVLTAGMVGSWLGVISKQSMLQARVMNLTAASAAVGGFFGFPMAGAMFVLEIPHRMGLQYFEALSPATIASIVAVLVNRMIVNNDVTGYYQYPFLSPTLPSHIFTTAIVYGLVGSAIGVIYAESVMFLKHFVHDIFSTHHHHGHDHDEGHDEHDENESMNDLEKTKPTNAGGHQNGSTEEKIPLVVHMDSNHDYKIGAHRSETLLERLGAITNKVLSCGIKNEPARAAVAGTLAGLVVGITCMFVPHVTFWGEAQLQTLIDKGRTPLPFFGEEKDTRDLTAYGFCLINPKDASEVAAGFSVGCAALITSAKIFVTGLSLGTGIIGGHFWGPLFVGCAASHLLTDLANLMQRSLGFGEGLAAYPCVSILCIMGSTHVVTFRAHMAIMLILTLTISAFDQGDSSGTGYTAGDYSAVFPLLVVSVFVSLMISRGTVFYGAQRSRGDIMALPQVLCEPGKEGAPLIIDYDEGDDDTYSSYRHEQNGFGSASFTSADEDDTVSTAEHKRRMIEKEFMEEQQRGVMSRSDSESSINKIRKTSSSSQHRIPEPDVPFLPKTEIEGPPVLPRPAKAVPDGRSLTVAVLHDEHPSIERSNASAEDFAMPLLDKPMEPRFRPPRKGHRRIQSAPDGNWLPTDHDSPASSNTSSPKHGSPRHRRTASSGGAALRERSNSTSSSRAGTPTAGLKKISSYGEVSDFQPSLMEQARARASSAHRRTGSSSSLTSKKRIPRGRHSRTNSNASTSSAAALAVFTDLPPGSSLTSVTSATAASSSGEPPVDTSLPNDDMDQAYSQASATFNPSIWS